jgi:hypothetical protein
METDVEINTASITTATGFFRCESTDRANDGIPPNDTIAASRNDSGGRIRRRNSLGVN